jgi:hypothetical protein
MRLVTRGKDTSCSLSCSCFFLLEQINLTTGAELLEAITTLCANRCWPKLIWVTGTRSYCDSTRDPWSPRVGKLQPTGHTEPFIAFWSSTVKTFRSIPVFYVLSLDRNKSENRNSSIIIRSATSVDLFSDNLIIPALSCSIQYISCFEYRNFRSSSWIQSTASVV